MTPDRKVRPCEDDMIALTSGVVSEYNIKSFALSNSHDQISE